MGLKFMRADENVLYGGTVTTTAGTTDTTYTDDWLVDGRGGRPAKATNGTVTWSAVGLASGTIGGCVVHSHNIEAARTITIAGGVISLSLAGPAVRTNGIPVNPWGSTTEASGTTVSVAVASNPSAVVIGELLAGKFRDTSRGFQVGRVEIGYLDIGRIQSRNRSGSVPDFDLGLCARYIKGVARANAADRTLLEDWYESTRNDTRPSVLIPFDTVQDAWVVSWSSPPKFSARMYRSSSSAYYEVQLEFEEWPRKRW
jgi:hypothetical protein